MNFDHMFRLSALALMLGAAVAGGCSSEAGTSDPAGSGADGTSEACADETRALAAIVAEHQTCSTKADCQVVSINCLESGRTTCNNAFYLNKGVDLDAVKVQDQAAFDCRREFDDAPDLCGSCTLGAAQPACEGGKCVPGDLVE